VPYNRSIDKEGSLRKDLTKFLSTMMWEWIAKLSYKWK
jgi:hypothetical protein